MTSLSENEALRLGGAEPLREEGEEEEVTSSHMAALPGGVPMQLPRCLHTRTCTAAL